MGLAVAFGRVRIEIAALEVIDLGYVLRSLRHGLDPRSGQDVVGKRHREVFAVIGSHRPLHVVQLGNAWVGRSDAILAESTADRAGHPLDSKSDPAIDLAGHDRQGDAVHGLHRRAALAVRGEGTHLERQSCQPFHRTDVAELGAPGDVAEPYVLDHRIVHLRIAVEEGTQHHGAGVVETRRHEFPACSPCECGPDSIDQHDISQFHFAYSLQLGQMRFTGGSSDDTLRRALMVPRRNSDSVALDDLTRRRTWAELATRVSGTAHLLREEFNVRPHEHVAVLMNNRVEYVETILGAIEAGVWITPVNRHLAPDEIKYVLSDSGARVVFTDPEHAALVETSNVQVVVAGTQLDDALDAAGSDPFPLDGPAGGTMIYTSGTTGRPKGVKRARATTLGAAVERMIAGGARLGLDGCGPHLVTGPLYHAAPLLFAVYDLLAGAPMIVMPRWDERRFLELVGMCHVRHTHLVPTMFVRLLRLPEIERRRFDPSPLHLVLHGAAPVAEEVKRRMIDWWGPVLVEYWGATEGGYCTLVDSHDWLAHPGTVGRATESFEVFAVSEDGRRLPPGKEGLLYCRHKTLERPFEYHGDPLKTEAAYLSPGVFTIGDMGWVDEEEYVYLTDRKSNMIISGGVNIYPAEIELVLQQHEAVADACVFGIPDEEWGESVKAAVELRPGTEPTPALAEEILRWMRGRLASYKVPRSIDFEPSLPRHPTGKIITRALRDRYWQGKDRNV